MTVNSTSQTLRALPSVDALLRTPEACALRERMGSAKLTALARQITDELRGELRAKVGNNSSAVELNRDATANVTNGAGNSTHDATFDGMLRAELLTEATRRLSEAVAREEANGVRHVINATGVILHTNLGRAPLSDAARRAVSVEAARYCTLEYDLTTGERGRRGARVEQLLIELTGAESALVVNNCAAAALLILSALACDGETIVSRGELVEIGGDFRVPDVMAASGTHMFEVGTTNRTRLADYERAINERTRLIMRVHPSNFRIVGFTASPELSELAALAHRHNLSLFEDAGSGALDDLSRYGLSDEPVIRRSIESGADVVCFSGDKLLGAIQAGLIVGRRELVERLRRAPLYRALRPDKLTYAALAATLEAHARETAFDEIPTLKMLALEYEAIERRARAFVRRLKRARRKLRADDEKLSCELIAGESAIGGGSAPTVHPKTALIALTHQGLSAVTLQENLRAAHPPVIARIHENHVVVDLRTVVEDEEKMLLDALAKI